MQGRQIVSLKFKDKEEEDKMNRKFTKKFVAILSIVMMIMMFSGQVLMAQSSGAIWTSDEQGHVNINLYDSKQDVYLNGGPNNGGGGLEDSIYYVKVTSPDGDLLGSTSSSVIQVTGGIFLHTILWGILNKASDGTLGYDTTSNNGGEYKVWVSEDASFLNSQTKTDNFKVKDINVPNSLPKISVVKTANLTTAKVGDVITYSYTVSNTGGMDLTNVTLSDNKLGNITLTSNTLAVGASVTGIATYKVLSDDYPGKVISVATATGKYSADIVNARDSASVLITASNVPTEPKISVFKTANPTKAKVGDVITYNYTVTNTGGMDLTNVTLSDSKLGNIPLTGNTLAVGASVTGTATYKVLSTDFSGPLTDTLTANGFYDGERSVTAIADATPVAMEEVEKELPITGGNPMAYLGAGFLLLALGLVVRKKAYRKI